MGISLVILAELLDLATKLKASELWLMLRPGCHLANDTKRSERGCEGHHDG
jgi:hypothetical protein